ncbi:exopolysaccharide synthesis ExoD [Chondrocystis sp. NIES-4102]|nr:exopolysaccharide synthesis ExoD [Chondrocystis sp. NIES-4102]
MSARFSQDIQILLRKLATKPIAIAEIIQETSERGFSLIIGLLVLPFLFPMPPGLSTPLGLGCLILGLQMALGRKHPWLPRRIAQFKFPRTLSQRLLKNVRRLLVWLEKIMHSRWRQLARNSYTWRGNGFCIAWLSILLMLPIPFTNPLPAIAILLLAVATVEADGLIMCLGYLLTIANTVFFSFIGYALWQAPDLLPNIFK